MRQNIIYFVDEDPAARRACGRALRSLLESDEIKIEAREPYKDLNEYNALILKSETAAFILDQRMTASGHYKYNGIDVANHLRNLNSKIPLYILTGHAEDKEAFEGQNHLVEYIFGKEEINDVTSPEALTIKARMLRNLKTYGDVRNDREDRYQELLIKSFSEQLTPEEHTEFQLLEGETLRTVLASEQMRVMEISNTIEQLQKLFPETITQKKPTP